MVDHWIRWILARRNLLWLGRLAVILVVLAVLAAPLSPIVTIGPGQQVVTRNSKMGVHTRLTDEVEEWKIKRTLEMVREMGAPWIVEYFPWAYYEPEPGRFNWAHPDMVVRHARAQGLTVVARLGLVPKWARPKDSSDLLLDESQFSAFGDFVAAFVRHFRGQVSYIIVWNEPNLSLEWGMRPVDPEGYTRLLKVAYQRAKEANPDVQVLGGALAPTLAPEGNEWGLSDLAFLQRMYQAGAAQFFDVLAVHAYGWTFPFDDPPSADKVNVRRVELVRQVMVDHGDQAKPIFISEGGWNDHPRWTKAVRPAERISNTIGAYDWVQHQWLWCLGLAPWAFRYPWPARTYQDYYTFVTTDFVPKAIYLEAQRYARGETTVSAREATDAKALLR
jgi:polysaccharide biosynthesis protein PslG